MNLDEWRLVFVSVSVVIILVACAPLVIAVSPRREEAFIALALLGENGLADQYFSNDDSSIEVGELVNWTLFLHNLMGEVQYVAVRLKLLNSSMLAPNSISCNSSPAPIIYEIRYILTDNEIWTHKISWTINVINTATHGNKLGIELLSVNNRTVETSVLAADGEDFRIIIELWVYNEKLNDFQFGWVYDDEIYCAWNQIWFNVILSM